MATSITRRAAVQLVTLASAALSAGYYFQQAPDTTVAVGQFTFNLIGLGLGATAFALDTVKPEMARLAGDKTLGFVRRIAAAAVFVILFTASMLAVDGILMKLRSDWAATRGHAITDHADARKVVVSLEAELAKVATARTTQQVRGAMEKVKISARTFKDTAECTKLNDDDDRRQCRPILDLREEMAAAIRKADIEPRLGTARAALATRSAPKSADPQADEIATWFGVSADRVAYCMVAILGFAVEVVACLGVWIVQKPDGSERSANGSETKATTVPAKPNGSETKATTVPVKPNGSEPKAAVPVKPNGSANGSEPKAAAVPVKPNGSGPSDFELFVVTEVARGRTFHSQQDLCERFQLPPSTVSEALSDMEQRGLIQRRVEGRRKIIEAVQRPDGRCRIASRELIVA
jgi:hypothetical protein